MAEPELRVALREALPGAMRAGDGPARTAIRSALAAIENAEAAGVEPGELDSLIGSPQVAGATAGVGAAEALRHELSESEILEIVSAERDERLQSAADYRRLGKDDEAERLEAEAAALDAFLC